MKRLNNSNYIGKKYGRLTIKDVIHENSKCYFVCDCDCGKQTKSYYYGVLHGTITSCGCYKKEVLQKLLSNHNKKDERLYIIWKSMKYRCNNKHSVSYKDYGMRGITVCKEWEQFQNFCDWAYANGYEDKLTIERIDPNGNYCQENCCWIDRRRQQNNKRNTLKYTINGITKSLSDWCAEYNVSYHLVYQRVHYHDWNIEKALTKPSIFS